MCRSILRRRLRLEDLVNLMVLGVQDELKLNRKRQFPLCMALVGTLMMAIIYTAEVILLTYLPTYLLLGIDDSV